MESALYSLWRINIENLAKNKLFICKDWHIQPSEIDRVPFYEYELYLESINTNNKEEAERQEKENKQYEAMSKSYKNPTSSFKAPSMPSFSMPKF